MGVGLGVDFHENAQICSSKIVVFINWDMQNYVATTIIRRKWMTETPGFEGNKVTLTIQETKRDDKTEDVPIQNITSAVPNAINSNPQSSIIIHKNTCQK